MKRLKPREILLLVIPLLILIGIGFNTNNSAAPLAVEKTEVVALPPAKQVGDPDTKVNVIVKYNAG